MCLVSEWTRQGGAKKVSENRLRNSSDGSSHVSAGGASTSGAETSNGAGWAGGVIPSCAVFGGFTGKPVNNSALSAGLGRRNAGRSLPIVVGTTVAVGKAVGKLGVATGRRSDKQWYNDK